MSRTVTIIARRLSLVLATVLSLAAAGVGTVPAAAQELSPEHLAVAREYIDLTDQSGIYEVALLETAVETMRTIVSQNPEIMEPVDDAISKTLESYRSRKGELLDQFARVYALNFTIEELEEIVAFYQSPVGSKLAKANATLNDSLQAVMQVFEVNLKSEFFAKVRAELKAEGYDV